MPSLHIAWALWCTVAVWQLTRRPLLRALGVVYPCLTAFAVLATGNHYLLDVLAGAALTAVSFACVSWAPRAFARARSTAAVRGRERLSARARTSPDEPARPRGACHKVVTKFKFG